MDLFEKVKEKGVLIAAHRGVAGGNIACNTIEAFEAALIQGADILEMDVFKTTDSQLYIFHTGKERMQLNRDIDVTALSSTEVEKLHYVNGDFFETEQCINKLDDVLEALKGRCLINLDRCWEDWKLVRECVERHQMRDQVILKVIRRKSIFGCWKKWRRITCICRFYQRKITVLRFWRAETSGLLERSVLLHRNRRRLPVMSLLIV